MSTTSPFLPSAPTLSTNANNLKCQNTLLKKRPKSYCEAVEGMEEGNLHKVYHDTEYGFAVKSDSVLFERLVLEINQAGLSWDTILKKRQNFKKAFYNFDIKKIASFGAKDRARLLKDAGIIRNRLKVEAVIHNAKVILDLQKEFGSFKNWLDLHKGKSKESWVKLFKKTFKFTGGEIVGEFLMSIGLLPGAHTKNCKIGKIIYRIK